MPPGNACFSVPLGPCTSTAPASTLTVSPFGIVIGFFPIRDIVRIPVNSETDVGPTFRSGGPPELKLGPTTARALPNITEHLSAHARLHGSGSGHHAARGRE